MYVCMYVYPTPQRDTTTTTTITTAAAYNNNNNNNNTSGLFPLQVYEKEVAWYASHFERSATLQGLMVTSVVVVVVVVVVSDSCLSSYRCFAMLVWRIIERSVESC